MRLSPALQSKMGLTAAEMDFIRSLPDSWLVVRMDDFDMEVQLSFFVLCQPCSSVGASRRLTKKTRGLKFMREAEFHVSGGTPLAHCTVLLRKRRRNVILSFLEKDLTRRTRGLNLGQFLVGVAVRAVAPFCPQDADMAVEAADSGSGKLVAFYERLGFRALRLEDSSAADGLTRMHGALGQVLAACSLGGVAHGSSPERPAAVASAALPASGPGSPLAAWEEPAAAAGRTAEDCAICIQPLPGDCGGGDAGPAAASCAERRCTLVCGHCFHAGCINRWLANSRQCPLCKRLAALQLGGA